MTNKLNVLALKELIASSIANNPHELDGYPWCKMSHEARWTALGISRTTLISIIGRPPGRPPFVSKTRMVDGIKTTLLRVGEPGPKNEHDYASMMVAVWRAWLKENLPRHRAEREARKSKLEKLAQETSDLIAKEDALVKLARVEKALRRMRQARETPTEFGYFIGLAKAWPDGMQVEIFKRVLDNLPQFMAGVRVRQALEQSQGKDVTPPRFLRYPHIKTILDYSDVALEMTEDHYQWTGTEPPAVLKALKPWKWPKPKKKA
ncbi:hypothetical protein RFN28_00780 [Mesorhizobium sp. VK24D]|uniref:Uncharacterized protein n=1 Tax=Mesorhizobium album TaxID=3072314 RepID=A0ABU4XT29_9HYPH|nr:hypothetical protein [Mesorhizobium sp. VK24D]MDX8477005.1 hypothetical protein [Mesorhizobium sp. VK24D]